MSTYKGRFLRRNSALLLIFTLLWGSLSASLTPGIAQAADPQTASTQLMENAAYWLKANALQDDDVVKNWDDSAGNVSFSVYGDPEIKKDGVNFNPTVSFSGNTGRSETKPLQLLVGDKTVAHGETYAVFKVKGNGVLLGATSDGIEGEIQRYAGSVIGIQGGRITIIPHTDQGYYVYAGNSGSFKSDTFQIATVGISSDENVEPQGVWLNGKSSTSFTFSPAAQRNHYGIKNLTFTPVIGSTTQKQTSTPNFWYNFPGELAEILVFPTATGNREQIESYLAIKYGMTLDPGVASYTDSNNVEVWTADPDFKHRITGIGRDSGTGLLQKQSVSQELGAYVTLGFGTITDTNANNPTPIANDRAFVIVGDNGPEKSDPKATAFTEDILGYNASKLIFKGQKSGWTEAANGLDIVFQVDDSVESTTPTHLLISSDNEFTNKQNIKAFAVKDGKATVKIENLNEVFYFRFAQGDPIDLSALQSKVQEVANIESAPYTEASWNSFLAAKQAAEAILNGGIATQAEVDAALAALSQAHDKLIMKKPGLSVSQPAANGAQLSQPPVFKGTAEPGAKVTVSLTGGQPAQTVTGTVYADEQGNWSLPVTEPTLQAGTYHLKVGAEKDGRQAEPVQRSFVLLGSEQPQPQVDKTKLQAAADNIDQENLLAGDYTEDTWLALAAARQKARDVLGDPNATQAEVTQALNELNQARAQLTRLPITVTVDKAKLQAKHDAVVNENLVASGYTADSWAALQTALQAAEQVLADNNATQQQVDEALAQLTDARNKLTAYTPSPGSSFIPFVPGASATKQTISIEGTDNTTKVDVLRTTHPNGTITDEVVLDAATAKSAIDKALTLDDRTARIMIPDINDEVTELLVTVRHDSVKQLVESQTDLAIHTSHGTIIIPAASLEGWDDDFYFRIVPVRERSEREAVELRAVTEEVVRQLTGNRNADVVSRPVTIETNLSSRAIFLELPMLDVALPVDPTARQDFLRHLGVYIEHSDGDKEVVKGEVVTMDNDALGLRFGIDRFSIFTIIHLGASDFHQAYISGYPDGTFGPDQAVTRAEMATMLSRLAKLETVGSAGFSDVSGTHWASDFISRVQTAGWMKGYPDGKFQPNHNVTRAEMAVIAANILGLSPLASDDVPFGDLSAEHWAWPTIAAVYDNQSMQGYPDGTFRPAGHLTRAEAVTILNRLFDRGPLTGADQTMWQDVADTHWAIADIIEASLDHLYVKDAQSGQEVLLNP